MDRTRRLPDAELKVMQAGWACVSLWLLPNVLYIIQIQRFAAGMPLFVIVTSGDWAFTLLSISCSRSHACASRLVLNPRFWVCLRSPFQSV